MKADSSQFVVLDQNITKLLKSGTLREILAEKEYFHAPIKKSVTDEYLSPTELNELSQKIKQQLGIKKIPALPIADLFDDNVEISPFCENKKNNSRPVFSIVIPTYQRKDQLKNTLAAINAQSTAKDLFEIIVVDDGSSDGTKELLKSEATNSLSNFKAFYIQRNESNLKAFRAAEARNIGIKASSGRYVVFLDSDIILPLQFFEQLSAEIKLHKIIQPLRLEGQNLSDESFMAPLLKKDWNSFENKWKYLCTYCLCIEKNLLVEMGGFRKSFSTYGLEDTELGYRLDKAGEKFHLMNMGVTHQDEGARPSIFERRKMMAQSAQLFYNTYLDENIYYEYIWLWSALPFEKKLSTFRTISVLLKTRGWQNLMNKSYSLAKSYFVKRFVF